MYTENNNSFFWQNDPDQATLITYFRQRLVLDFQVKRSSFLSCLLSPINIPLQVHNTLPLPALSNTTDDNFRVIRKKINIESHILKRTLQNFWTQWIALTTENFRNLPQHVMC